LPPDARADEILTRFLVGSARAGAPPSGYAQGLSPVPLAATHRPASSLVPVFRPVSKPISESTFFVAVNGATYSPPASGLIDFLLACKARRVTTVFHPLEPENPPEHVITVYEAGEQTDRRVLKLPSRPPYTYLVDPLIPAWPEAVDGWFGFNNLMTARGLGARSFGRAGKVVYWAVDFVPDRFGAGSPLTRAYDALDRLCCTRADARFELSVPALEGRTERLGLDRRSAAPAQVVPVGAWVDAVPRTEPDAVEKRRVVFVSHLVPRSGARLVVEALGLLTKRGVEFTADIAGSGPLEQELRATAAQSGLDGNVRFHGFVQDQRDVEKLMADASVALAPYNPEDNLVSPHADPSKLKAYIAAGLPIVMTDTTHNSKDLAREGGAELIPYDAAALADGIERALASPEEWSRRRAAALEYARRYDWASILRDPLASVDFRE
jgi:glycosyltransferase involved in cell wall biosynthesis